MLQTDPIEQRSEGLLVRFGIPERGCAIIEAGMKRLRVIRERWARFWSVLLDDDPRKAIERIGLAVLLYAVAVLGREALHTAMPAYSVRYLTFFPALLASGLLCGLVPSMALLVAFSITGFVWIEPTEPAAPLVMELALTLTFALAGAGVIIPAVYGVNAHRRLARQEEYLSVINNELHHRLKNLFSVISSICIHSLSGNARKKKPLKISSAGYERSPARKISCQLPRSRARTYATSCTLSLRLSHLVPLDSRLRACP